MALSTPYTRDERIERLRRRGGWTDADISDTTLGEIIDSELEYVNIYGLENYDVIANGLAEEIIIRSGYLMGQYVVVSDKVADGVNYRLGEVIENESSLANSTIRLIKLNDKLLLRLFAMFDFYLIRKEDEDYDQFTFTNITGDGISSESRGLDWLY